MTTAQLWTIPAVASGVAILRMAAVSSKARKNKAELLFGGSLAHRVLIIAASGSCTAVVLANFRHSDPWETVTLIALSIALLIAFPPTIAVTSTALERRLWWRKTNRIPWTNVSSIQRNPVGDYTVYGQQQPPIFYSRYYIDGSRLAFEVARRTKIRVIDTPEPAHIISR